MPPTKTQTHPDIQPVTEDRRSLTVKSLDDRYVLLKNIGKGSFGHVSLARVRSKAAMENEDMRAGSMVAIKTMKKKLAAIDDYNLLREVEFIREVRPHRFLVNVHDMFVDSVNHHFHMSMEVMEMNLYNLMKAQEKVPFQPHAVRSMLWQIICGIDHIHRHNFFHRDIKPENILVSRYLPYHNENSSSPHSGFRIKIADFGLSRHIEDRDPYTAYVSTRWYRAPEILLRCEYYSAPVDIWAFGAMAAEVANLKPLFPGTNELDQFSLQVALLGTPGQNSLGGRWGRHPELCSKLNINIDAQTGQSSNSIMCNPEHASLTDVVLMCLTWDPDARCSARDIMYHRYFAQESSIEVPRTLKRSPLRITKQAAMNPHGDPPILMDPSLRHNNSNANNSAIVPTLASSLKQNQGLQMNKSHLSGVNGSTKRNSLSGAAAAAAMSMSLSLASKNSSVNSGGAGFLAGAAPAKKKFGHWANIFKRDSDVASSELERVGPNKENVPSIVPTQTPNRGAGGVGIVPKIPLPQLPPLETIAASIESLSIEARSTNTTLTERMTSGPPTGGTSDSEWSTTNASISESVGHDSGAGSSGAVDKGSTGTTNFEVEALMESTEARVTVKTLPQTPDSASSYDQMPPPPLPLPKVRVTAKPLNAIKPESPTQVQVSLSPQPCIKPPSPASSHYEPPACLDEHSDSQLTAYERSVRDSVLLMSFTLPPSSQESCTSLEGASESPSVNDSPLVDQFGGSSSDIRIETTSFLTPDLDKGNVWVRSEELECSVYPGLQTNSFRDRKIGAGAISSNNIEVE
ncbi:YALIA101S02e21000g1_1 [Yarrowia lipolytica]|nr:Meiosis induction protein kinase IME2/SME1 [Yarrowia lipolytica]SEI32584.1 YALIA101S02e21000g1_1 [Yarrowia lipolytica]